MNSIEITNKNCFNFLIDYYGNTKEALNFFNSNQFEEALILPLSAVCIVPKNKPQYSRSKQTHIHVTGNSRYFFYPKEEIDKAVQSTSDKVQQLSIDTSNLERLSHPDEKLNSPINIVNSFTVIKIACRDNQESQVQVSKLKQDDQYFLDLRNNLYTQDLLIFLKYKHEDRLLALGIDSNFYKDKYLFRNNYIKNLESQGNISVKTALEDIENTIDTSTMITSSEELSDSLYQQLVDNAEAELDDAADTYTAEKFIANTHSKNVTSNRPNTNPILGKSVIMQNDFKCIFATPGDPHNTFLKPDGSVYMEVHHLIPVSQQHLFENKLDTKANLVPLCPLCHCKIHRAQKQDVYDMLSELYTLREASLIQSGLEKTKNGIPLTQELLKSFY